MINLKLQDKNIVHCDYTTQGYGSPELKYGKNRGYVAKSSSLDNRIQRSASLNTILESKMEKVFHPNSYGFDRLGRSVHDALSVVQKMTGIT